MAIHLVAAGLLAPTIQPPDVEVPVIEPRVQAFMSRQPLHPSTPHRATPRSPIRWSANEDALLHLWKEGYMPRELIDYPPLYRTVDGLTSRIQNIDLTKPREITALWAAREAKRS